MKFGRVPLPELDMPRLGLAAFRRRLVFHLVFLLLAGATLALALSVLIDEKQRSYQRYQQGFGKTLAAVAAQLRHPTGQLALLNPRSGERAVTPLSPLLLPFSAIDFDDPTKAQRAVEMSGCAVQYASGASLCVAVGSNAYAGGFIYLVGSLVSGPLQAREPGALDLSGAHRVRLTLNLRGQSQQWIAPFEAMPSAAPGLQRGRLTAFAGATDKLDGKTRPQRDFRGWLWREGPCLVNGTEAAEDTAMEAADCPRRSLFSIRLPVDAFREALYQSPRPVWPPQDLAQIQLRLELLGPSDAAGATVLLFDSNAVDALRPFSLQDLSLSLQAGETLQISRESPAGLQTLATRHGPAEPDTPAPWLTRLVRHLPVQLPPGVNPQGLTLSADDSVLTPLGRYRLHLSGDLHSLDRSLAASAARLSWLVGAMLAFIALSWLIIELGLIRRVAVLTQRAAALSHTLQESPAKLGELEVADLRGSDELGILAGSLADMLQKVREGVRREQLRAEQERDMWHAVGHEIMSPLQSLMVLHGQAADPSHRYVQRMQQAVKVLYGSASPSEALASADLALERLDLDAFLTEVAANAAFAGIDAVHYEGQGTALWVHADAYSLEDAITHVLRNAARYRPPGSAIRLGLMASEQEAVLSIHNSGPPIEAALLDKIFEYGVSDAQPDTGERRGQGLFVSRTYLAKMDGRISARNVEDGVVFELRLRRLA